MKRIIIGSLVASVIFFAYQSVMWMSGMHRDFSSYTPNQDSIISSIEKNVPGDGLFVIPWADPASPDRTKAEEEMWTKNIGKPWAMIFFHRSLENMESTSMIIGFVYVLLACLLTCFVVYSGTFNTFGARFLVSMSFSLFTLFQSVLNDMNWWSFPWSFVGPEVIDLTIGWAITSLWIAMFVKRN